MHHYRNVFGKTKLPALAAADAVLLGVSQLPCRVLGRPQRLAQIRPLRLPLSCHWDIRCSWSVKDGWAGYVKEKLSMLFWPMYPLILFLLQKYTSWNTWTNEELVFSTNHVPWLCGLVHRRMNKVQLRRRFDSIGGFGLRNHPKTLGRLPGQGRGSCCPSMRTLGNPAAFGWALGFRKTRTRGTLLDLGVRQMSWIRTLLGLGFR